MNIAIFADIHGKILLPFLMVDAYQKQTGKKIDLILQCGDLGAFSSKDSLDKATLRHAQKDRDELGFMDDFVKINPKVEKFLNTLDINMYAVRGNHEDHKMMDRFEQESDLPYFPIDCYQRVFVCKTAEPQKFSNNNTSISWVGVGRIGDRKNRTHDEFIQPYEKQKIKSLIKQRGAFDLLITHDKDLDSKRGYGMVEIEQLLDEIPFTYMFHGHTGEDYHERLANNGITNIIKIRELEFNRSGILEEGSMVILNKQDHSLTMESVPLSFLYQFQRPSWKLLLESQ